MKIADIIFALGCGGVVGLVASDVLEELEMGVTFYHHVLIWLFLALLSLFCLWLAYLIGKKIVFMFQAAKFFLVGAFATVIDLKLFELLAWFFPIYILAKSISFIISTLIKYWGNKYWTFQKSRFHRGSSYEFNSLNSAGHEEENIQQEIFQFFIITLVGLVIDVSAFYYATNILGPQFAISDGVWVKLSVIFAALVAALWNFLGYKFFVFKK